MIFPRPDNDFRVVALLSAHNEDDVIYHVIGDLVKQGIKVYLLNHCSTDSTVEVASQWLGKGLLHIEHFPQDAGYPERNKREYIWSEILMRKQELAHLIDSDWIIHHDADEFRESPWPEYNLLEAIRHVDSLGYSAIDFELFNFRPVDNRFVSGTDVREALQYYEGSEAGNGLQIKAWKKQANPVDLVSLAGHSVTFDGRNVCPVKFILRHYPVRSQEHGLKKVIHERKARFNSREVRAFNWHTHYNGVINEKHNFLHDPVNLQEYDPALVRSYLLTNSLLEQNVAGTAGQETGEIFKQANIEQSGWFRTALQKRFFRSALFMVHDCIDIFKSCVNAANTLFRRHD